MQRMLLGGMGVCTMRGGGMWKEVDARDSWADGPGGCQSCVPVSKDILWEEYFLATFS